MDLNECGNVLHLNTFEDTEFNLFPNPSNSSFTIESEGEFTLQVYTLDGKLLLSDNAKNSYTSHFSFSEGIYLIHVSTANGETITKKWVKTH